jgi:hypothetical protein
MNYEEEVKVITHEEARNLLNELVPTDAITPSQIDDLHIYITEQEKKEKRAKKVEELLGLIKKSMLYRFMLEWGWTTKHGTLTPKEKMIAEAQIWKIALEISTLEKELCIKKTMDEQVDDLEKELEELI